MKSLPTIIVVLILVGCGVYASYYVREYQQNHAKAVSTENPEKPDDLEIIQPKLDIKRGKKLLINPSIGGVLEVTTNQGIVITLVIPPDALARPQTISLVPFAEDGNQSTLDTGVLITPGNLVFTQPASLLFSSSNSASASTAHIYRLIPRRQTMTPVLISRGSSDTKHITGRILSGGAYSLSLISTRGEALSRVALSDKNSRAHTILEAASYLVGNKKSLSLKEIKVINAAILFMTNFPYVPEPELYAAVRLDNLINNKNAPLPIVPPTTIPAFFSEETPIIEEATPSAAQINTASDTLNQDAYVVIQPFDYEGSYNSMLESIQEPTPTPPDFSDNKF